MSGAILMIDDVIGRLRRDPRRLLILSAVVGAALAIFMIGKLVFSGFSILDDHTIAEWIGPQRHVGLGDFWRMFDSTELAQYGSGQRYRPFMYLMIIFETLAWGSHPAGFHAVAIIWLAVFLWAVAWASFRSIGIIGGCCILFLVANGRYWGNIFTHSTMPSEQPAAMGLGLIIFGLGLLFSWFFDGARRRVDGAILLIGFGSLVCLGSKENFLPMAILDIVLVAWVVWARKIGRTTLVVSCVIILLNMAICYGIVTPNIGRTIDMYGVDNGIGYRLRMIHHSPLFRNALLAMGSGAAAAVWAWRRMRVQDDRDARAFLVLGAVLIFAGLYLIWEIFFYVGRLPAGQRYDFPALLINPILAGAALYAADYFSARMEWSRQRFSPLALRICFALLILNIATAYFVRDRLFSVRQAIQLSNDHTRVMREDLLRGKALASQHPDWPIIVAPSQPMNYEAVVTFPIWMHFFEISNPASIWPNIPPSQVSSRLDKMLVTTMQAQSLKGIIGLYVPTSATIERAKAEGRCFVVEFGTRDTRCVPLPYRPNEYYPVD
jgi:hypothetical protein